MKILKLIRGLPGSGKSTLAEMLMEHYTKQQIPCAWYEADMFFVKNGIYTYDKDKIGDAHNWCKKQVSFAMQNDIDVVIVSNTFCRQWEAEPYLCFADIKGYNIQVISLSAEFGSVHNVPEEALIRMKERWESEIL